MNSCNLKWKRERLDGDGDAQAKKHGCTTKRVCIELCPICKFDKFAKKNYFLFVTNFAFLNSVANRLQRRRKRLDGDAQPKKHGYTDAERICIELRDLQV